jgi:hypothetical protein
MHAGFDQTLFAGLRFEYGTANSCVARLVRKNRLIGGSSSENLGNGAPAK